MWGGQEGKHCGRCSGHMCIVCTRDTTRPLSVGVSVFFLWIYVSSLYIKYVNFLLITCFGNNHLSWFLNFNCGVLDHKMKSRGHLGLEVLNKVNYRLLHLQTTRQVISASPSRTPDYFPGLESEPAVCSVIIPLGTYYLSTRHIGKVLIDLLKRR